MKDIIRQVLQNLNNQHGAEVFTSQRQFKSALGDALGEMRTRQQIEASEAKRVYNLLIKVICDMEAYSRLEAHFVSGNVFAVDNMTNELSSDHIIPKDVAQMVMECVAELVGYEVVDEVTLPGLEAKTPNHTPQEGSLLAHELCAPKYAMFADGDVARLAELVGAWVNDPEHDGLKKTVCAVLEKRFFSKTQMDYLHSHEECIRSHLPGIRPKQYQETSEGDVHAQYELGVKYLNGRDVEQSDAQAAHWFKKAAEQGFARAQYRLGLMYYDGRGVVQNHKQAADWFIKAAEQGYAPAQYDLGWAYDHGGGLYGYDFGIEPSATQAVYWYKKAAEQDEARAQYELGYRHWRGKDVEQNTTQAVHWYGEAAKQGHHAAQYELGRCYENGQGVEQNDTEAVYWYKKAAEQGSTSAKTALKRFAGK